MGYLSVAQMADDSDLLSRVTACAAVEGEAQPALWTQRHKWAIAAQPGWGDAWQYAIDTGVVDIGKSSTVITDAAILSAVQAINSIRPPSDTAMMYDQ